MLALPYYKEEWKDSYRSSGYPYLHGFLSHVPGNLCERWGPAGHSRTGDGGCLGAPKDVSGQMGITAGDQPYRKGLDSLFYLG